MTMVKTGRLIDHLHLRAGDLEASRRFYRASLDALGLGLAHDAPDHFVADELYVDAAEGQPSRVHLAFQAADRASVDRFHAAFLLDPDGNNIEAAFHGPSIRSATAVEITPAASVDAPGTSETERKT